MNRYKTIQRQHRDMKKWLERSRANLELTHNAYLLWVAGIGNCFIPEDIRQVTERLIENCARDDWGQNTHCAIHRDSRTVFIEADDGRKTLLSPQGMKHMCEESA